MSYRVTSADQYRNFLQDVNSSASEVAKRQRSLSDGLRIHRASDDPVGARIAISYSEQLSDIAQYQRNVTDAQGKVAAAEQAVTTISDSLVKARDLAMQATSGLVSANDLAGIASQLQGIRDSVFAQINAKHGGEYVFAGTATGTAPYAVGSNNYAGDSGAITSLIEPGATTVTNLTGNAVLGADGTNVLDTLDQLISDVTTGTPVSIDAIRSTDLPAITGHMDNVIQQLSNLGAIGQRLEQASDRLPALEDRLTEANSNVVDADYAKTYAEFQAYSTMYEAALSAGSRIMQTSLMDFI
jgi:flagellar hook-associated protein 3 FlgL